MPKNRRQHSAEYKFKVTIPLDKIHLYPLNDKGKQHAGLAFEKVGEDIR